MATTFTSDVLGVTGLTGMVAWVGGGAIFLVGAAVLLLAIASARRKARKAVRS